VQTTTLQVQVTPVVISEPQKSVQSESVSVVTVQSEPEISDLPPLENDSGPT
jgi:hypothetical protein